MGHVEDRWTVPGPDGAKRVRGPRWGSGKRWRARWVDPDGKERAQAFSSKDEAVAHISGVDVKMRSGAYIDPAGGRATLQQYGEAWLRLQVHYRPGTVDQAKSRLKNHVYPTLGQTELARIRRSDVQGLVAALLAKGLAPSTVRVTYVYLAAVLRSAVEDRLIAASPCSSIRLPEVDQAKVVPLTVEQVEAIAERMIPNLRGMVWLGAGSGMRPGELRGLTIDRLTPRLHLVGDVVPAQSVARVDRQLVGRGLDGAPKWGPGKTPAADRSIALSERIVARLVEHLRDFPPGPHGLVFSTSSGMPLRRSHLTDAWARATREMSLRPRSGWHELRHHHASLLIAAGLSPRVVADRLGHADPAETLRTYSHLWPSDEDRALAAVEAAYGAP